MRFILRASLLRRRGDALVRPDRMQLKRNDGLPMRCSGACRDTTLGWQYLIASKKGLVRHHTSDRQPKSYRTLQSRRQDEAPRGGHILLIND